MLLIWEFRVKLDEAISQNLFENEAEEIRMCAEKVLSKYGLSRMLCD